MGKIDNKIKHLEFIQLTIVRMAANSFLLKAWGVTLVAALFAVSVSSTKKYILIAYLPVISFWVLDAYYLHQERLFRGLYDKVRKTQEKDISFSLNTSVVNGVSSWSKTIFSTTLMWFYGPILMVLMLTTYFLVIK